MAAPLHEIRQDSAIEHIVLLVHGIRTRADWAEMVAHALSVPIGTVVIPVRYGYFGSVSPARW